MSDVVEFDARSWRLIALSTIGVSVSVIPVSILSLGVFIKPLGMVFGWSRGELTLCLAILSLAMAAAMPIAGRLIDRFGVRWPVIGSLVLYGGSIGVLPALIGHFGLAGLYTWGAWAGAMGSASSSIAYIKVLTAWFDRSRGLALGFAMSGVAVGGAITPLLAATLIEAFGWQAGFYGLALLAICVGVPVGLSIREKPVSQKVEVSGKVRLHSGMTSGEALRSRVFWILFLLFLTVATAIHGIQIHLAPLLSDRGLTPSNAALGMTFMFAVSFVVRLVAGYLFDRHFAPWIGAVSFLCTAFGCVILIPEGSVSMYLVAVVLLGVGAGAESDLLGYLVSRYFGLIAFGAIYGWIFAAFMIGSAIGPFLLGVSHDGTGSYTTALQWCTAGLVIGIVLLLLLPKFPQFGMPDRTVDASGSIQR